MVPYLHESVVIYDCTEKPVWSTENSFCHILRFLQMTKN